LSDACAAGATFSTSRSFAGYSLDTDHSEFNGPTLESNAWDIDSLEIVILFPLQILASVFVSAMKRKILTEQSW
jgi:hypothetical protein